MATQGDNPGVNEEAIGSYVFVSSGEKNNVVVAMWVSKVYYSSKAKVDGYRLTYN